MRSPFRGSRWTDRRPGFRRAAWLRSWILIIRGAFFPMLEIELKAALTGVDAAALTERLAALGFSLSYECRESDTYYNGADRDFCKTDEALRVREHERDGRVDARLTYKGPKTDARSQTRAELETGVESAGTLRALLGALGYARVLTVKKARRGYVGSGAYAGVNLCLDEVEGLGAFIELEYPSPDDSPEAERESRVSLLLSLLDALRVPRQNLVRRSYLELLIARAMS